VPVPPESQSHLTFCQYFSKGTEVDRITHPVTDGLSSLFTTGNQKHEIKNRRMSKFSDIIKGDKPVLIDFSAEWCAPCRMMPPILKDVKKQLGDRIRILKIDVDRNPAIAQKYQIGNVPTLMVFKNGQVVFRQAGVIPAQQIVQLLQPHL